MPDSKKKIAQKYFGTDGIRAKVGSPAMNPESVLKLGWAAGKVLSRGNGGKVLIGKDTRISGYMLESALEAGLSAAGINIHLLGPMPTPAIAYLTRTFRAQAGIVISASHNLFFDNGIKFFSTQGTKISGLIEEAIEAQMAEPMVIADPARLGKAVRVNDAVGRYIEFCKSTFPTGLSLSGLKIVIDCAQGATYHVAPHVFRELGAKVIAIHAHPDGLNINAECGSTHPEALQKKVLDESADLGIAFDGDGDRVIMIDHQGSIVDGDELLFIMARDYKQRDQLRGGVVGTIMTNMGFELAMRALSIDFVRSAVGDRHVMEKLREFGWFLGGEASGHIVNLGLTTTGDGIVSALQVLRVVCEQKRTLRELTSGIAKFPNVLINVPVSEPLVVEKNEKLQEVMQKIQKKLGASGRVLLRASGTEPVVRVMVEGSEASQVQQLTEELAEWVAKCAVES